MASTTVDTTSPVCCILVNGKSKRAGPPRRSEDDYCEIKYPNYGSLACYGADGIGNNMYASVKRVCSLHGQRRLSECEFDKTAGRKLTAKPRKWVGSTTRNADHGRKSCAHKLFERLERYRTTRNKNTLLQNSNSNSRFQAADNRPPLHNAMMSMGNQHAGEGILSNSVYENRGGVAMREAKKMAVR